MKKITVFIISIVALLNIAMVCMNNPSNKVFFSFAFVEALAQNENDDGWTTQHEKCVDCETNAVICVWEVSDGGSTCTPADCSCGKVKGGKIC